ncbi:ABC transporter permease [Catenulispora subtropica]|uniref:ABC transporter permease n=1 Tax=Catenulispora subtropica TaxID=450798 RepID=A0ABN2T5S3_9ACTN
MTTLLQEVRTRDWSAITGRKLFWPLLILVALMLFNLPFTPNFFAVGVRHGNLYGSVVNILNFGAKTVLVALGMTLVIATGGIDLSVGAVMAIAGAVACKVITDAPDQNSLSVVFTAIGLALAAGAAAGLFNGVMVARAGVQPIIATLVLMVAGRGIAQLVTDGRVLTESSRPFGRIGGFSFGVPTDVLLVVVLVAATSALTRRTAFGLLVEAVGGNSEASRLAGVRSRRIKLMVYLFCALCAATAGLVDASTLPGADANHSGLWIELDAILAVVIGGTPLTGGRFSIGGTVVGALILQTLKTTIFTIGIPSQANMVFEAGVVIIICLLQSEDFRDRAAALVGGRGRGRPARVPAGPSEPASVEVAP